MKQLYLPIFFLVGCGGKSLENSSYSVPGSSGKIDKVNFPHFKEEKLKNSSFLLGPYLTLKWNHLSPYFCLHWIPKDPLSSFQVEYGTLKEGRKEVSITKKNLTEKSQLYSAVFSPLIPNKEYSYTILQDALSCYTKSFFSTIPAPEWKAIVLSTPSTKIVNTIKNLAPQWIFTSWQPKDQQEIIKQKDFFDTPAYYIWNPLSKILNFFRSTSKNELSISFKAITFKIRSKPDPFPPSNPTCWITSQSIYFTGLPTAIEPLKEGFVYLEKNKKNLICSFYNSEGLLLKKHSFPL